MMTTQEAFDTVVRHLHTQGKRSIVKNRRSSGDECRYRTDDGLKCAIGCLIPDEVYSFQYEGLGFSALFETALNSHVEPLLNTLLPLRVFKEFTTLGSILQMAHDKYQHWDDDGFNKEGVQYLRFIAHDYRLDPSVINELWGNAVHVT